MDPEWTPNRPRTGPNGPSVTRILCDMLLSETAASGSGAAVSETIVSESETAVLDLIFVQWGVLIHNIQNFFQKHQTSWISVSKLAIDP